MPEPECFPDGRILYLCPLGCNWGLWATTPELSNLNSFVETTHQLVSEHYQKSHGVVAECAPPLTPKQEEEINKGYDLLGNPYPEIYDE